ncbi:btb/poz domain-containing protein [Anaeramoeba ignava]|uniref:Btb/poz domain-containing protein n=1 Tax=Anaeramoeba ignava TaxID=1746090 RepID=A0A9Q0LE26_ANAIG|nr:btb/poz domain-containing protein [Anaeramoeba ignava]
METYLNLEKLSNDLKNLFQNQKKKESYFDFEIICEQNKTSFKTHKSILSSRSKYFKSLFNSKMKEFQENKLVLQDVSSSILSSILSYFYSGKIEFNLENAIQILFFSSKYLIDELIGIASNFIKNNLQFETVVDILKLSESMNFNQLIDSSYQFILENFEEFIKTSHFLELEENHLNSILSNDEIFINEFELFQSIIKWGKHKSNIIQEKEKENQKLDKKDKEKLQIQISNVIQKIRFIDFSKQELKDTLKEDLIPNQISQRLNDFQKLQNQKNETKRNQFIENQNSLIFKTRKGTNFKSTIAREKEYITKLKEWINDNEFFFKMKKGYSAKRDGFDCKKWHDICDDKGKTLVIIKTEDNFIFGGFTQVGFTSDKTKWNDEDQNEEDGYIFDSNAFIFSLRNDKNDREPKKFPIRTTEKRYALFYNYSQYGPYFGDGDFIINSNMKSGSSEFGLSYKIPETLDQNVDEAESYLAGSYNKWKIEEIECFSFKKTNYFFFIFFIFFL